MLAVPPSHPGAGQPLLLPPPTGMDPGGHSSLGGHPPNPTASQPGRTRSGTAKLLRPREHQSGCWYSVSGKSAAFTSDGKRVVVGGGTVAFCTT